jgi:hypothetical protein
MLCEASPAGAFSAIWSAEPMPSSVHEPGETTTDAGETDKVARATTHRRSEQVAVEGQGVDGPDDAPRHRASWHGDRGTWRHPTDTCASRFQVSIVFARNKRQ